MLLTTFAATMRTILHPPEFQEQLLYRDLELMQLRWPTFKTKVNAETFWKKFQNVNHSSVGEIARMLSVLFPNIDKQEAYIGHLQCWIQAMFEQLSVYPTVNALMTELFIKQEHCHQLKLISHYELSDY